ncbi:hypothetical protein GCM10025858_15440 [Alicyclobacillus sacchari]|nr:hypothetical protein GCM10025858_15440 [Alicyclobacillus sacchari]
MEATQTRAVAKYIRIAPRKMRLVVDLVRGKGVQEALAILKFTPRVGSRSLKRCCALRLRTRRTITI